MWAILCVMMGTAAWLIWRERYHRVRNAALLAYATQLGLNAAWAAAVRSVAAWLLVPHLGWASIAAALNLNIWRHN